MGTAELRNIAKQIRYYTTDEIATLGVGHIGGSLSIADLLAVLYFKEMNVDPKNPNMENRDRLVVSKGHAGPAVYAALALKGYFPMEELKTLNVEGTNLPSHCDRTLTPGIDMTAGSLGQGISAAVGMAQASRILDNGARVYCIIGDGESQEGQVWEACMSAVQLKLDNLIVFMDYNKMQIDGTTEEIMSVANPAERFKAFGFNVYEIDGHDIDAIVASIDGAKQVKVMGEEISVKARIMNMDGFSAHADYTQIEEWLQHLTMNNAQQVFVVHGEATAAKAIKEMILEEFGWNAYIPYYADRAIMTKTSCEIKEANIPQVSVQKDMEDFFGDIDASYRQFRRRIINLVVKNPELMSEAIRTTEKGWRYVKRLFKDFGIS